MYTYYCARHFKRTHLLCKKLLFYFIGSVVTVTTTINYVRICEPPNCYVHIRLCPSLVFSHLAYAVLAWGRSDVL